MEKIIWSIPVAFIMKFTFEYIGTKQNRSEMARVIGLN